MTIVGGFSGSRQICFVGGHFSKWIFAEGRSTRSLWCPEKIQGPIWRSKDHLVMKGLSKNVKNHDFKETHYSVRQKIGEAGSISTQNIFPISYVVSKRPESPYVVKYLFLGVIFQNWFSPKAVQPGAPRFRGDPKTNLEARRPMWRYLVMKWVSNMFPIFPKNMKIDFPHVL